jgi:hypothetical protein
MSLIKCRDNTGGWKSCLCKVCKKVERNKKDLKESFNIFKFFAVIPAIIFQTYPSFQISEISINEVKLLNRVLEIWK